MSVKFSLTADRYDQSTFSGRFRKMLDIVDPTTLFSTKAQILQSAEMLQKFRTGTLPAGVTDEQLWQHRKLKESAIHPDTGEFIPRPCRMAGYVPYNGPVCVGAVMAQRTPWILFWHWVNQTQNALVNYFNRNATSPITTQTLAMSYCGAVGSAVTVAFGLVTAIKKFLPPATATLVLRWVALPASCIASCTNCFIMRRSELSTGIMVIDEDGAELGKSKAAARKAMKEMLLSRAALQPPVFGVPALVMSLPAIVKINQKNPKLGLAISTVALLLGPVAMANVYSPNAGKHISNLWFAGFEFGLPATIALFPQKGSIDVDSLEPEFQNLTSKQGKKLSSVYYNKGL